MEVVLQLAWEGVVMNTRYEALAGKLDRIHRNGAFEMEMGTHVTHVSNWIRELVGWNDSSIK